jgi:hypothetical protein
MARTFPADQPRTNPSIRVRVKFSQRTQHLGRKLAPGLYQLKLTNDDGECVVLDEVQPKPERPL